MLNFQEMNTLIIVFLFCVLLSIDCATKSKHYLVKVGDNDDNKQADDENGFDGKNREPKDYLGRD